VIDVTPTVPSANIPEVSVTVSTLEGVVVTENCVVGVTLTVH